MDIKVAVASCGAALVLGSIQAQANGLTPSGTIIGVFSNVVTNGYVLHYPTILSPPAYFNNGGTAVFSITNSTDPTLSEGVQATGSKLQWGAYPPGEGVSPEDSFSELIFFGAQIPADIHQPFEAGIITFLNGTSSLDTLIFGAYLSLYDNYVTPQDYLGTDFVYINTTNNLNVSLEQDADYINICGNGSNICGSSIEAFEDSEGGTGVTAILDAQIVGDPQLQFTNVSLAPGQDPDTSGLIGSQAPASVVPEPSTWALMLSGFVGLGAMRLRGRRSTGAAPASRS